MPEQPEWDNVHGIRPLSDLRRQRRLHRPCHPRGHRHERLLGGFLRVDILGDLPVPQDGGGGQGLRDHEPVPLPLPAIRGGPLLLCAPVPPPQLPPGPHPRGLRQLRPPSGALLLRRDDFLRHAAGLPAAVARHAAEHHGHDGQLPHGAHAALRGAAPGLRRGRRRADPKGHDDDLRAAARRAHDEHVRRHRLPHVPPLLPEAAVPGLSQPPQGRLRRRGAHAEDGADPEVQRQGLPGLGRPGQPRQGPRVRPVGLRQADRHDDGRDALETVVRRRDRHRLQELGQHPVHPVRRLPRAHGRGAQYARPARQVDARGLRPHLAAGHLARGRGRGLQVDPRHGEVAGAARGLPHEAGPRGVPGAREQGRGLPRRPQAGQRRRRERPPRRGLHPHHRVQRRRGGRVHGADPGDDGSDLHAEARRARLRRERPLEKRQPCAQPHGRAPHAGLPHGEGVERDGRQDPHRRARERPLLHAGAGVHVPLEGALRDVGLPAGGQGPGHRRGRGEAVLHRGDDHPRLLLRARRADGGHAGAGQQADQQDDRHQVLRLQGANLQLREEGPRLHAGLHGQ
mmetsp:Transcript_51137/g.131896  ORF Transcript_51137/g.131896 Transcript_51137/m.131896 type:complete len:569 (+) Transcript_51137:658-2364(+)